MFRASSPRLMFLLQAEDGIRYCKVTGVQTCALPTKHHATVLASRDSLGIARQSWHHATDLASRDGLGITRRSWHHAKIGRAPRRERVQISAGAVSLKKK